MTWKRSQNTAIMRTIKLKQEWGEFSSTSAPRSKTEYCATNASGFIQFEDSDGQDLNRAQVNRGVFQSFPLWPINDSSFDF